MSWCRFIRFNVHFFVCVPGSLDFHPFKGYHAYFIENTLENAAGHRPELEICASLAWSNRPGPSRESRRVAPPAQQLLAVRDVRKHQSTWREGAMCFLDVSGNFSLIRPLHPHLGYLSISFDKFSFKLCRISCRRGRFLRFLLSQTAGIKQTHVMVMGNPLLVASGG